MVLVDSKEEAELDEVTLETLRGLLSMRLEGSLKWSTRLEVLSELLQPFDFTLIKDDADHNVIREVLKMARMDFVSGNSLIAYEIVRCLGAFQLDCSLKSVDIPWTPEDEDEDDCYLSEETAEPINQCQRLLMGGVINKILPGLTKYRQVEMVLKVLGQMRIATEAMSARAQEEDPTLGYALQHIRENRYTDEEVRTLFVTKWSSNDQAPNVPEGWSLEKKKRFLIALAEESLARKDAFTQACARELKADSIELFATEPILGHEMFKGEASCPRLSIKQALDLLKIEERSYRELPSPRKGLPKVFSVPPAKLVEAFIQYYEKKKALQQLREHISAALMEIQDEFTKQQDALDEQENGIGSFARQDRLKDKKKRIAVIGYCLESANISLRSEIPVGGNGALEPLEARRCQLDRHECPVLVRKETIKDDIDPESPQKLFEIGACNGGTYVVIHPSNEEDLKTTWTEWSLGIAKHDTIEILQYIPPHKSGIIGSKPLEKVVISGYTHLMLSLPELGEVHDPTGVADAVKDAAEAGTSFLIELPSAARSQHDSSPVRGVHNPFTFIGVDRVSSDAPVGNRSLDRFLIIFSHTNKLANLDIVKELKTKRYKESVGVIADALSLRIKSSSTTTRLNDREVARKHMLLFFASAQFLRDFGLFNRVRKYWDNVEKRLEQEPHDKREALALVLDLTIHNSPFDAAVARDRTILHLPRVLSDHLRTELHVMPLELSNFQAVCDELERVDMTCAAPQFFLIRIQGKITAQAIQSLIQRTSTSVKIIFEYGVEIEIALNEHNTAGKRIRGLGSIGGTKGDEDDSAGSQTLLLDPGTCFGGLVAASFEHFARHPEALVDFVRADVDMIRAPGFRHAGSDWLEQVTAWVDDVQEKRASNGRLLRAGRLADDSNDLRVTETARLLVTRSPDLTISLLKTCPRIEVQDIDASAGTKENEDELRKLTEPFMVRSAAERPSDQQPRTKLIVLRNPSFLRKEALSLIVYRCAERQDPILLLSPSPSLDLTVLQLPDQGQRSESAEFVATVNILEQHLDLRQLQPRMRISPAFQTLFLLFGKGLPQEGDIQAMVRDLDEDLAWFSDDRPEKASRAFLMYLDGTKGLTGSKGAALRKQIAHALWALSEGAHPLIQPPTKDDSLAIILVRHAFAAIISRGKNEETALLGYAEFAARTRYSYLSQIHRVEAYLHYLSHHIDVQMFADRHPCVVNVCAQFCDVKNVLGSQLGDILHATFVGSATEGGIPSDKGLEQCRPLYERPMGANALTDENTIFENACLNGNAVDVNLLYTTWKNAAGIPTQLLTHLLCWGRNPAVLILSLDIHHIANLSMSFASKQFINRDQGGESSLPVQHHPLVKEYLNGVEMFDLLKTTRTDIGVSDDTVRICQDRLSAFGWLLMRSQLLKSLEEADFDRIIRCLVASDIRFDIDTKSSSVGVADEDDLLLRVTKVLVQLDAPVDLLTSRQHIIKDFMMASSISREASLQQLFTAGNHGRLGRAFVHLCAVENFNPAAVALKTVIRLLSSWSNDSGTPEEHRRSDEEELRLLARNLSPAAAAGLLCQASNLLNDSGGAALQRGIDLIVQPCLNECRDFTEGYDEFLAALKESNSTLAIKALEVLTSHHTELFRNVGVRNDGFWDQVLHIFIQCADGGEDALKSVTTSFPVFLKVASSAGEFPTVAASQVLMNCYRDSLVVDPAGGLGVARAQLETDLQMHCEVLGQDMSFRESAFRMLNVLNQNLNRRQRWLLWYAWCAFPDSLLIHEPESVEEWEDLRRICGLSNIMTKVATAKSLSFLARFLCMPHTLPVQAYKIKADMAAGPAASEREAARLQQAVKRFAQEGHTTFPPYVFRVQQRGLPRACITELISLVEKDIDRHRAKLPTTWTLQNIWPRATEGVSVETLRDNLHLLANLQAATNTSKVLDKTSATIHLAQVLLAWFKAAGITYEDMHRLATVLGDSQQLQTSLAQILTLNARNSSASFNVFVPLPLFLDVRFLETSFKVSLFGKSVSSMLATQQWIDILRTCYEFDDAATQQMHFTLQPLAPLACLPLVAESICASFVNKLSELYGALFKPGATVPSAPWSLDTSHFIDCLVTCVEFLHELTENHVTLFFDAFARCLAGGADGIEPSQAQRNAACVISDSFFALIGLNPVNRGSEVVAICNAFARHRLSISSTLIAESRWLIVNLFRPDVATYLTDDVEDCLARAEGSRFEFRRRTSMGGNDETMAKYIAPYLDWLIRTPQSGPPLVQPFVYDKSLPLFLHQPLMRECELLHSLHQRPSSSASVRESCPCLIMWMSLQTMKPTGSFPCVQSSIIRLS